MESEPESIGSIHVFPGADLCFDSVRREIEAGYINEQRHPTAELRILNYSRQAQFDGHWNAATLTCRGLIVDDHNRIVARPFPKFFSYEQLGGVVPAEPFEVFEKMDGSLGVLYRIDGQPFIATRGSFTGQQAVRANEIYSRRYQDIELDPELTYLFEIIYPQNRIVVDYGDTEDLILLAVIETASGIERPPPDIGFPLVKRYDGIADFASLLKQQDDRREGWVVRFKSGKRVKIKFDEYKRLHNLLTGVSPKHVWEALRAGDDLRQLVERVPDEFFDWVRNTEADLRKQFAAIEAVARRQLEAAGPFATRKEAAMHVLQCEYPDLMFQMLDGKDYADKIWRMIRPVSAEPFRCAIDL